MPVTIKKIARDLQLAVSTVSKALRDSHEISAETKQRIFDYAAALDYIPNPYASSLKRRKTGNIAVVLPEVEDSFFSTAINGIESVAQHKGYHVIVYLTHEDPHKEQLILRDFRSGRVDGVLLSVASGAGESNSHLYAKCLKEIPLVFFDRACAAIPAARVLTDDFESGYKAADHLISRGCTAIAFLAMTGDLAIINDRLEGYKKAHFDHGLRVREKNIIACTHDESVNTLLLKKLLLRKSRPDGIIGSVEKVTTQAYAVCKELNLAIPRQVKIIGFSNLKIAPLLNPALTTITQPAFAMGQAAASLLFKALEKKKADPATEKVVLPSTLCIRTST